MKIIILGGTGMLGHRLWLELSKRHEVLATIRGESPFEQLKSFQLPNIQDFDALETMIRDFQPEVVINCVGLIKQAGDHDNVISNIQLNALLPHKLDQICEKYAARLILFSTDCVFSGSKGLYRDSDFADADDIYGRTKKLGEIDNKPHVLTIRTSIIGRGRSSLVEWFLSQENKQVRGYRKAIFSGFPTKTVADILEKFVLQNKKLYGVYNVSSVPISKFDLISLIRDEIGLSVEIIPYDDFEIDRSLDSSRFKVETQFSPQGWKELVKDIFVNDINYEGHL